MGKVNLERFDQSIQVHLGILQSIISRMATNSGSCKAYCVTLVSAILVIVADKGKPNLALIAGIPILLFLLLDTYYLAQEQSFRDTYNDFVRKYQADELYIEDLFSVAPTTWVWSIFLAKLASFAIWPFYLTLGLMVFLAKTLVIPGGK